MVWPASDVNNSNTSSATTPGQPAAFRADVRDLIEKFNLLRNHVSVWARGFLQASDKAAALSTLGLTPKFVYDSIAGGVTAQFSSTSFSDLTYGGSHIVTVGGTQSPSQFVADATGYVIITIAKIWYEVWSGSPSGLKIRVKKNGMFENPEITTNIAGDGGALGVHVILPCVAGDVFKLGCAITGGTGTIYVTAQGLSMTQIQT